MFSKKSKNMSTKQEIVSDASIKTCPFSYDFTFACKDGLVIAATCKYYCPLFVNPVITNCCKEIRLCHAWNLVQFCVKTESHCVFLLLFTVWWNIFDQVFRWLLPLSCFYGSSQWLLKVKVTCKRLNFIKSKIRFSYVCLW